MDENINIENKKRSASANKIGVRIIAGILAFLMVASMLATVVVYLIK